MKQQRTWCCWRMSGRPLPCRTAPMAVSLPTRWLRAQGARQKRRLKRTTDSHHAWPVLLDQDFTATGPDKKWGAGISYVWKREGWLYLAVVIDLFARRPAASGPALARSSPHRHAC